jgi:adenylate kinase
MVTRKDDTAEVVRARLAVYRAECGPVEEFYKADGRLSEFHITGGIPETLPRLLADVLALVKAQRAAGAQGGVKA